MAKKSFKGRPLLAGNLTGKALASKSVVGPTELLHASRLAHSSSTVCPRGVTHPIPVTTTRLRMAD